MNQLFSAYGAARVLEVDRETITRAVRGHAPDGFEHKQPRWRLARIVEALSERNGRSSPSGNDASQARSRAVRDVAGCRSRHTRDGRRSGEDRELTSYRCDRHLQTALWTLREPCGWSFEEILAEYNSAAQVGTA